MDFLKAIALCVGVICHFILVVITFLSLNEKQRERNTASGNYVNVYAYAQ